MSDNRDEIKKYMKLVENEHFTGNETKVEVSFKDGEEIEVEVHAQGTEELKRLMDLAGIFHKDKQGASNMMTTTDQPIVSDPGMDDPLALPEPDMMDTEPYVDPLAAPDPDIDPLTDLEPDMMDVEPDIDPLTNLEPDMMDVEPEFDADLDPIAALEPDMDSHMMDAGTDEMDPLTATDGDLGAGMLSADDFIEADLDETTISGQRHDYGYPNPNLGQERYKITASGFSSEGNKPIRMVPARSGDNPMLNTSKKKTLGEYMQEITNEKNTLTEVDFKKKIDVASAAGFRNVPLTRTQQVELERRKSDLSNDSDINNIDGDDIVTKVADDLPGMTQVQKDKIRTNAEELEDHDVVEGKRKRQYSFKNRILPFQGLTGVQRVSRNAMKTAKRELRNK